MNKSTKPTRDSRYGRCQCGTLHFRAPLVPLSFYACHCTDCRAQSASAFGLSYLIRPDDFFLVSGKLKTYLQSDAESMQKLAAFCGDCGTRVHHASTDPSQLISIKAGALVDISDLTPIAHIWTDSALPWVDFSSGGARCFNTQPREEQLISLWGNQPT